MKQPKLCQDCKWFVDSPMGARFARCANPKFQEAPVQDSLVSRSLNYKTSNLSLNNNYCYIMRNGGYFRAWVTKSCGAHARGFEKKD